MLNLNYMKYIRAVNNDDQAVVTKSCKNKLMYKYTVCLTWE